MIITENDTKQFNATSVNLAASNLIEASAGTGKTYSIAVMVLRLILENKIPVKEILMVTYTKAAVAELEDRIRVFIRQAYKVSSGGAVDEPTITALVKKSVKLYGRSQVTQLLKDAVLFLDETSVLTIHSFCQQTLLEFAFETNQLFNSDTLEDLNGVIEDEVNKFWRKHITTLNSDLLSGLIQSGLKRKDIIQLIKDHLAGKKYFAYEDGKDYKMCEEDQVNHWNNIARLIEEDDKLTGTILESLRKNKAKNKIKIEGYSAAARNALAHLVDDPERMLEVIRIKKDTLYIRNIFPEIIEQLESGKANDEREAILQSVIRNIYCHAIGTVDKAVERFKQQNSLLSFDDMIVKLHKAVVGDKNKTLIFALQKKYKAVFVDEFQDTDKLQYEIFYSVFDNDKNILFYIGDPKQSIYAWRKADIFTYFKAASEVAHVYTMNINYRSSSQFINAMNLFFKPHEAFDTFSFDGKENGIVYTKVESPKINKKGELLFKGMPDVPVTIFDNQNIDAIIESVTAQIIELLQNKNYQIVENGTARRIRPSDIGILVRANDKGSNIKAALAKRGIPAITIDEIKVLETEEAKYVLYLLEALIETNRATINRALLTPFTPHTPASILKLDEQSVLNQFKAYKITWDKDGVYSFLAKFVSDYNVHRLLYSGDVENGDRVLANLFQVIEVLHKIQSRKQFSPPELLNWLKRGIDGMQNEGDEFEQRLESDEDAVKIVTIHKSKGLEYNIVFAPFLDMTIRQQADFSSFRNPDNGDYVFVDKHHITPEQKLLCDEQAEQENRRLIYVAITRAVYKCYINKSRAKDSSLVPFYNAAIRTDGSLIQFKENPEIPDRYMYRTDFAAPARAKTKDVQFDLQQTSWKKVSYTSLAGAHIVSPKNNLNEYSDSYDSFVFKQLSRGSKTGNLLHYVFENIDFTDQRNWEPRIRSALKRFIPAQEKFYTPLFVQLLHEVTSANIKVTETNFQLGSVIPAKRLNELEFDFNLPLFDPSLLSNLMTENNINIRYGESRLEGIMNGKMDMFFEYDGKYFILDWKSNFLGDSMADYRKDVLHNAMSENNYHLQYLLYTLAAKKFLESRLKDFDYEKHFGGVIYLFVRGVRAGSDNGVYTTKPGIEVIEKLEKMLSR